MGQNEAKADLRKEFKFGSGHVILRCLLVDWAVGCKSRILGRGPGWNINMELMTGIKMIKLWFYMRSLSKWVQIEKISQSQPLGHLDIKSQGEK